MNRNNPILYIVIPCYNEEKVLPYTNPMFIEKIESLINTGKVHPNSKVMYVNDGSKDKTWTLIQQYAKEIVMLLVLRKVKTVDTKVVF